MKRSYIVNPTVLETPHVAVGAAIATKIPNPFVAIPLALASHFILEKVPHWNPHLNTETEKYGRPTKKSTIIVIIDTSLALVVGGFFAYRALPNQAHAITILAASLASVLPDLIEAPYFFLGVRKAFIKKWILWQKSIQADTDLFPGLATQLITVLAAFWWIVS